MSIHLYPSGMYNLQADIKNMLFTLHHILLNKKWTNALPIGFVRCIPASVCCNAHSKFMQKIGNFQFKSCLYLVREQTPTLFHLKLNSPKKVPRLAPCFNKKNRCFRLTVYTRSTLCFQKSFQWPQRPVDVPPLVTVKSNE